MTRCLRLSMCLGRPVPARRRFHAARLAAIVGGSLLIFTTSAVAHTGTGLAGGIPSGFRHPFAGFDHLLAMVSVGLWGAVLDRPLLYALPVIFPVVMVGGAVLGMLGVRIPPVEIGIALSVLVLGGCIALSLKAPVWVASLIVATFAVFHGYAHGKELPSAADPIGYSSGFVLATGLLHLVGIGIGCLTNHPGGMVAMRSVGAGIAVMGVWFFYKAVGV
jgi:urease accessory protein